MRHWVRAVTSESKHPASLPISIVERMGSKSKPQLAIAAPLWEMYWWNKSAKIILDIYFQE